MNAINIQGLLFSIFFLFFIPSITQAYVLFDDDDFIFDSKVQVTTTHEGIRFEAITTLPDELEYLDFDNPIPLSGTDNDFVFYYEYDYTSTCTHSPIVGMSFTNPFNTNYGLGSVGSSSGGATTNASNLNASNYSHLSRATIQGRNCTSGKYILLTDITLNGVSVLTLPEPPAPPPPVTWTVEYPSYYITATTTAPSTIVGYIHLNWGALAGSGYSDRAPVYSLGSYNNFYEITSRESGDCNSGGGTGTWSATSTEIIQASRHTGDCASAGTYYHIWRNTSASSTILYVVPYEWTGSTVVPVDPPTQYTHIEILEPDSNVATSTASSTTVVVSGHITEEDFQVGTYVRVSATHQASSQQWSKVQAWELVQDSFSTSTQSGYQFSFLVTEAGDFEFSTTTDMSASREGRYTHFAMIDIPVITPDGYQGGFVNFFTGLWQTLLNVSAIGTGNAPDNTGAQKTVFFTLGGLSPFDEQQDLIVAERDLSFETGTSCNPLSEEFDAFECLYWLLVPSNAQMSSLWQNFTDGALTHAPLGYLSRFIVIITGGDATMPPALEYTFGTASPDDLQGKTMSFQIFENFGFLNSVRTDDGQDKDIWEVVMPFFNQIIGLGVLGVILYDLGMFTAPIFNSSVSGRRYGVIAEATGDPANDDARARNNATLDMRADRKMHSSDIDMRKSHKII